MQKLKLNQNDEKPLLLFFKLILKKIKKGGRPPHGSGHPDKNSSPNPYVGG
jgi:hypothetical protein